MKHPLHVLWGDYLPSLPKENTRGGKNPTHWMMKFLKLHPMRGISVALSLLQCWELPSRRSYCTPHTSKATSFSKLFSGARATPGMQELGFHTPYSSLRYRTREPPFCCSPTAGIKWWHRWKLPDQTQSSCLSPPAALLRLTCNTEFLIRLIFDFWVLKQTKKPSNKKKSQQKKYNTVTDD